MTDRHPVSWVPFVLVALALAAGTMGATMASPLYPLYEQTWTLRHSTITILYVVYMVGVLAAFLFLGRLSDHLGPIAVLKAGCALLLAGLLISACSPGVRALAGGRAVIGIASGMITTAATLGLFALEPGGVRHASLVASTTTMAGFGLGPFASGLLAQFAPAPLVIPYIAIIVPVAVIFCWLLAVRIPRPQQQGRAFSFLPHLGLPRVAVRPGFLVAALAVFSAYAMFSLLASLAPSFLTALLPWRGPAVSGTAVATVLFCSALVQIPARRLSLRLSLGLALGFMIVGVLLLAVSIRSSSGTCFILSDIAIGLGHGLAFMSGLGLVDRVSTSKQRSDILATFLCIAYLGTILPTLAVGYMADGFGLQNAVTAFCLTFAALCFVLLLLTRITLTPSLIPKR